MSNGNLAFDLHSTEEQEEGVKKERCAIWHGLHMPLPLVCDEDAAIRKGADPAESTMAENTVAPPGLL